ncbi:MAG: hypothetical protein GXX86_10935, partial [Propionibacterium sp.]|nr:hypothetical protein [Propionibacterium sp.]
CTMSQDHYSPQGDTKDEAARQAGEVKDHAVTEAAEVKDHAATAAQDVAGTAGREAKSVARDARDEFRTLVDSGLNEVNTQAGHGQRQAAEQLRSVVEELDGMVQGSERYGLATKAAQELADRGRGLAGWLENHEPRDAVDEVRRYAARNPWTFLAIAAGAGLLVGRFVRGARDDEADDPALDARRMQTGNRSIGTSYAPPAMAHEQGFQPDPAQRAADPGFAAPGGLHGGPSYGGAPAAGGAVGYQGTQPDDTLGTTGGWADPQGRGYPEPGQGDAEPGRASGELYDERTARRQQPGEDPFEGLGER